MTIVNTIQNKSMVVNALPEESRYVIIHASHQGHSNWQSQHKCLDDFLITYLPIIAIFSFLPMFTACCSLCECQCGILAAGRQTLEWHWPGSHHLMSSDVSFVNESVHRAGSSRWTRRAESLPREPLESCLCLSFQFSIFCNFLTKCND